MNISPPAIWATNDGEKIDRDRIGHALSRGNSVWNGRRIKLFGARNEVIAFQLIVEAPNEGIHSLSASLHELTHQSGTAITYASPSTDPSDYVGRPIQLFAVRYMNVLQPTNARWIYRSAEHNVSSDRIGWKPVQLVPENASRDGFPLAVAGGLVQAIWIEIYLRRDLPAGTYHGRLSVSVDGVTANLPVELELFDFSLPDVNSLPAMIYYESEQPELYHGRNLDPAYHRFAHRHRVELVQGYGGHDAFAALGRFRGDDFTRALGYEGPGEGVGNTIAPFSFYAPGTDFDERTSAWRTSDEWMRFIAKWLPDAITFLYLFDEPTPEQFPLIRQIAANIKSNPGPGSRLPLLVTRHYTPELDGAIDIWNCGAPHYNIQHAEAERARGRDHWACNGGRPEGGAVVIDAPATDARMLAWACFKHGIKVYFYWHSVHWMHNSQKPEERVQNVWANTITFDNRGEPDKPLESQGFGNGDGVLMYPGEDTLHPAENRGIAGPISTIQLANLRRGLQDHLYLTLAQRCGLVREVRDALQAVVPRVFSDAPGTIGFADDGDAYEIARYRLAVAISAAGR
ncbi:MAG: DUF4091 domain-containing protein [Gemmatimonadota bacterium]|nr:DUF4091 domain-containing protein [Gemmatimonadota bacterium]